MSNRVMQLLREFSPDMEIYSIDEAFLYFSGMPPDFDYTAYGETMRQRVTQGTGIPISVGVAPTKALAKAANRIAKKYPERTGGVYVIDTDEKREKALRWLPVEDVWGIGRQHAKRLKARNINTAYDFTRETDAWVKANMAIVGLRLKKELQGESCLQLEMPADKKSIATTRSFVTLYTEFYQLRERVSTFASTCAAKLRKQGSVCNSIMVFVHTNFHRADLPQYSRSAVIQLPYPTNSSIELSRFASQALRQIYKSGYAYKKAGVVVMDIQPEDLCQLNIFENSNPRHKALMAALDAINENLGVVKVKLASQDAGRTWKMRQEKLSPRYTTRLTDIISVRCG
jgi:DNA polymerase V